jgi:hypothetical protein
MRGERFIVKGLGSSRKDVKPFPRVNFAHFQPFSKSGSAFFTLYDGWREGFEPLIGKYTPHYKPVHIAQIDFMGYTTRTLHRFYPRDERCRHRIWLSRIHPILNDNLLAFNRHKGDLSVTLIPDVDFIESNGYAETKALVDQYDQPWENKVSSFVWRGNKNGSPYIQVLFLCFSKQT